MQTRDNGYTKCIYVYSVGCGSNTLHFIHSFSNENFDFLNIKINDIKMAILNYY